jgi:hypothetical protein
MIGRAATVGRRPTGRAVGMTRGGGGQGDGIAELFELVDQTAGLALGVTAANEEVVGQVLVALPVLSRCQMRSSRLWATATAAGGPTRIASGGERSSGAKLGVLIVGRWSDPKGHAVTRVTSSWRAGCPCRTWR